jgi:hypothetical protein
MLRNIVIAVFLLALPSRAIAAETRVDYDRQKDFSRYRTFAVEIGSLILPDGSSDEQNTLTASRLRQAVTRELNARGLESTSGRADLVIRVSSRESERTEIVSSGWSRFGPYRGWGYFGPYGYYNRLYNRRPYFDDVWTYRYFEGSLRVDIVERNTGALIYRAQVTDRVGKDVDKYLVKGIDRAFKKYPVKELAD